MKFSCYKNDLVEALNFAARAVAVKPQTPILSGLYMRINGGNQLEIQANNLSTGIVTRIPAHAEVGGEVAVGGKRLLEFVRKMPDDTITLTHENNLLTLQAGGASVDLLTMNAEDFPKIKTPESKTTFEIKMSILNNLIRKTVFSVAKDETRPVFTGVNFIVGEGKITAVATNTHRLALQSEPLSEPCEEWSFVVPGNTLRDLISQFNSKDAEEVVRVEIATGFISFFFFNNLLTARRIEGQFPPYDKVIPKETATHVSVDTAEFKKVINFISLMSKETQYNTVKFDISKYGFDISSNSPEVGGASQSIECTFDGEPIELSFNVDYISDYLYTVDGGKLQIDLNDKFSPIKITEPTNPDYVYIVTPVRA